jgi:hypothetical protein
MAVVNVKSSVITNSDAMPPVINSAQLANGRVRQLRGQAAVANGDSIASTYRLLRVKSNDIVSQLLLSCTAITSGAGDVGLYRTANDGGAVVDADFFASAQSIASALSNSDISRESGVVTVANMEKPIWQALSLTEDPQVEYDVVITLTAAAAAAGNVALIGYVVGKN